MLRVPSCLRCHAGHLQRVRTPEGDTELVCPSCDEDDFRASDAVPFTAPEVRWSDIARVVGTGCLLLASLRPLVWGVLAAGWALGLNPWPPPP